jgi:hypothetical protein
MRKHGNHGEERAEHMERVQAQCDQDKTAYPPELIQWLANMRDQQV